jgi:hypothetical protein
MFVAMIPTKEIDVMGVIFVTNHLDRHKVKYEMNNGRIYLADGNVRITCYNSNDKRYRKDRYYIREYGLNRYVTLDELIFMLGAYH